MNTTTKPHGFDALKKLSDLLERETALVRAGDLTSSSLLQSEKNSLMEQFQTAVAAMDEDTKTTLAEPLNRLSELLKDNMSALRMAKDVSAGIIKRVSDVVNGPRTTNSYGSNAMKPTGPLPARRGIAVDKGF